MADVFNDTADMVTDTGPMRQCDCDALDRVLRRNTDALTLALACKDCGWEVDAYIAKLQEQLDVAAKSKAKFFPHHT
jgi:hypothetical protein